MLEKWSNETFLVPETGTHDLGRATCASAVVSVRAKRNLSMRTVVPPGYQDDMVTVGHMLPTIRKIKSRRTENTKPTLRAHSLLRTSK